MTILLYIMTISLSCGDDWSHWTCQYVDFLAPSSYTDNKCGDNHEVITTSFSKSLPSQKLYKQRWCACLDSIALVTYHYTVEDWKPIYISCLSAYLVPKGVSILWGTLCVSSRTYSHIARRGRHNRSWNEGRCFCRETKS